MLLRRKVWTCWSCNWTCYSL